MGMISLFKPVYLAAPSDSNAVSLVCKQLFASPPKVYWQITGKKEKVTEVTFLND
jgi:hypothetical protein